MNNGSEARVARGTRLLARVEAVACAALLNRRAAVGKVLRNAWSDAARVASLAVRRANAAGRGETPQERAARSRMAMSGKPAGAFKKGAGGVVPGGSGGGVVPPSRASGSGGVASGGFRAPAPGAEQYAGAEFIFNGERYVVHGDALIHIGSVTDGPDQVGGATPSSRVYDADAPGAPLGYENMLLARLESAGINVGSARSRLASQPRRPRIEVHHDTRRL